MSLFKSLNLKDWLKGLYMAVVGAITTALIPLLQTGHLPTLADLKSIGIVALGVGLGYIAKNLLTNSKGQVLTPEPPKP